MSQKLVNTMKPKTEILPGILFNSDHSAITVTNNGSKSNINSRPFQNNLLELPLYQYYLKNDIKAFLIREVLVSNSDLTYEMIFNLSNTELANLIPKSKFSLAFLYELIHETYFNAAGTIDNKRKNKLKRDEFKIIKEYNKISNDINFDDKNRAILRKLNKSLYEIRNRTLINDSIRNIEKRVFEDERVCQPFFSEI